MRGCSFIGHKDSPKEIRDCLLHTIEKLIVNEKVDQFYVGTQGHFDKLVYEVLCDLEKRHKIQIFVVLAYLNQTPSDVYYDMSKTVFPDVLTKTPLRFAIRRRNTFMIDRCDYIISYLNTPFSNTYNHIEEAVRKNKRIINLGSFDIASIAL